MVIICRIHEKKEKMMKKMAETEAIVKEKEYVIHDCNIYIENLTEQVNEKVEEAQSLTEQLQNKSYSFSFFSFCLALCF